MTVQGGAFDFQGWQWRISPLEKLRKQPRGKAGMLRSFHAPATLGCKEQGMTKQTLDVIGYVCLSDQNARDRAYGRVLVVERSARDAFSPLNRHRRAVPDLPMPKVLFAVARTCTHVAGTVAGWVGWAAPKLTATIASAPRGSKPHGPSTFWTRWRTSVCHVLSSDDDSGCWRTDPTDILAGQGISSLQRKLLERAMGFEPTTSSLARTRSTTELRPLRRGLDWYGPRCRGSESN